MIGIQLADVSTRCSSHPQGKGEARCQNLEAFIGAKPVYAHVRGPMLECGLC